MRLNKNSGLPGIGDSVVNTVKNILESLVRHRLAERFTFTTEKFDVVRSVPRTSQGYSRLYR